MLPLAYLLPGLHVPSPELQNPVHHRVMQIKENIIGRAVRTRHISICNKTHTITLTHLFAKLSAWRRRLTNEEVDVVVRQLEHSRVKVLLDGTSDQGSRGPEDHVDVWIRNQPFDPRIVQQFALFHLVELTQNLGSSLEKFKKKIKSDKI